MSKQIAQTVGGKRIAWLLAIVAAFAVIATLATQWEKSAAAELTPAAAISQDVHDASIPSMDTDASSGVNVPIHRSAPEQGSLIGRLESVVSSFRSLIRAESTYSTGISDGRTVDSAAMRESELDLTTGNPRGMSIAGDDAVLSGSDLNNSTDSTAPTSSPLEMASVNNADRLSGITCWTACKVNAQTKTNTVDTLGVSTYSSFVPSGVIVPGASGGVLIDEYVQLVERSGGQTLEYIDTGPAGFVGIGTITDTVDYPALSAADSFGGFLDTGQAFIPSASWADRVDRSAPDGISSNASFAAGDETEASVSSSSFVTGSDVSATWLYVALGLGALAFGVGGTAVARRSR